MAGLTRLQQMISDTLNLASGSYANYSQSSGRNSSSAVNGAQNASPVHAMTNGSFGREAMSTSTYFSGLGFASLLKWNGQLDYISRTAPFTLSLDP